MLGKLFFISKSRLDTMTFVGSVLRDSIQCVVQDDGQIVTHHHHSQQTATPHRLHFKSPFYVVPCLHSQLHYNISSILTYL